MVGNLLLDITPPQEVTYRSWFDVILIAAFVFFAFYKAIRLVKSTRLGWSFAAYNACMGLLFLLGVFIVPAVGWDRRFEELLLTCGRISVLVTIVWSIYEVEMSRQDLIDFPLLRRRGHGQQT
jgi:predicted transporter